MGLKENINKLHSSLTSKFEDVSISEKSSVNGNYFEIKVVNEGRELFAMIRKVDIENDNFNWTYYSNPISKEHLVERVSFVNKFTEDVTDIFLNNRFCKDYK